MEGRLRFADRVTPIKDSDDGVYLHSWTEPLSLRGRADHILPALMPLLDGSATADEIATALDQFGAADVRALLTDLHRAGILEEVDVTADAKRGPAVRSQVAFLSQFALPPEFADTSTARGLAQSGAEYQDRLAESRVIIFGAGRIGARLVDGLVLSGVGRITIVDPGTVSAQDIHGEARYDATQLGKSRAEALLRRKGPASGTELAAIAHRADGDELEALLDTATFAVVCPDPHDPDLFEAVNRAAIAAKVSWTSARMMGLEFRIGPTILPGETACYRCFQSRIASNTENLTEHRLVENFQRQDALKPVMLAATPGVDLLVLEVVKALTWFTAPSCYGHLYTLDLISMEGRRHPVLKIPRCPDCGRPADGRPTIHAWQQSRGGVS